MKLLALVVATAGALACANVSASENPYAGWTQVSDGVFANVDANGVVTTVAMGPGGALHDRLMIEGRIAELAAQSKGAPSSELQSLQEALAGFPAESPNASIEPKTSLTGSLCSGYFWYSLDSHFVAGGAGATAVARVGFGVPPFGPPPILTSITQYNTATVTPQSGWGSPVTSTYTRNNVNLNPASIASWQNPDYANYGPVTSPRCSASTYAYVQLSSAVCAGGTAFISQSKSYPTA